jgi:hypothetical protein
LLAAAVVLANQVQGSVTFEAAGTFLGGGTLSGTLTIDVTAGVVTAADLVVGAPYLLTFGFVQSQGTFEFTDYEIQAGIAASGLPDFDILLPTSTLIGYGGGEIGSISQAANGFLSTINFSTTQALLDIGSLTPVAVPEPSTSLLMGSSFGILAIVCGVAKSLGSRTRSRGRTGTDEPFVEAV